MKASQLCGRRHMKHNASKRGSASLGSLAAVTLALFFLVFHTAGER